MGSAIAYSSQSLQSVRGPDCGAGVLGWVINPPRLVQNLRSKSVTPTPRTCCGLGQCGQLLPRRRGRLGAGELVLAGRLKGDGVLDCCLGGGGGEEQVRRFLRQCGVRTAAREPLVLFLRNSCTCGMKR